MSTSSNKPIKHNTVTSTPVQARKWESFHFENINVSSEVSSIVSHEDDIEIASTSSSVAPSATFSIGIYYYLKNV